MYRPPIIHGCWQKCRCISNHSIDLYMVLFTASCSKTWKPPFKLERYSFPIIPAGQRPQWFLIRDSIHLSFGSQMCWVRYPDSVYKKEVQVLKNNFQVLIFKLSFILIIFFQIKSKIILNFSVKMKWERKQCKVFV